MTPTRDPLVDALRAAATGDLAADLDAAIERAERDGLVDIGYEVTDSPVGPLFVAVTDAGVVRVGFAREPVDAVVEELAARVSPRVLRSPRRTDEVRRQLDEYFAGRRDRFEVGIDWRLTRGFRRTVLERLYVEVPYGRTVSYRELAMRVGNPAASRAVGSAMATNPIPIVVPCHRVLRSGGHLGGYGGGLPAKRLLLALESGEAPLL